MGVLTGRSALITGGASGIGRATAILFAREGAKVFIVDINTAAGRAAVEEISSAGGSAWFGPGDVSVAGDVNRLVAAAAEAMGGLDIVVNVAGVQLVGLVEDMSEADFDRTMAVNVRSIFLTTRAALPHLRKSGRGVILSTSSTAAVRGSPGEGAYSPSKAAILALTQVLAKELARDAIRVNCVCPGVIDTPFNQPEIDFGGGTENWEASVRQDVPLKRQGTPAEVAPAFLFLASDGASYVTGHSIYVDGGYI